MKIKFALIPNEYASKAQEFSDKLQIAMDSGDMSAVDQLTEELMLLTDNEYSLSLTEKDWHQFIEKIRCFDGEFKSDYIIGKPQLETIVAASVAEPFANALSVVEQALKTGGVILQLPFEGEDTDV